MNQAVPKAPVFRAIDESPRLLDAHANFLAAGGEKLLMAIQETFAFPMWPWDKPAEHTAQYGAFCAGVAQACRILKELNTVALNRKELGDVVKSMLASANDPEQVQRMLIRDYGYTEADFPKEK